MALMLMRRRSFWVSVLTLLVLAIGTGAWLTYLNWEHKRSDFCDFVPGGSTPDLDCTHQVWRAAGNALILAGLYFAYALAALALVLFFRFAIRWMRGAHRRAGAQRTSLPPAPWLSWQTLRVSVATAIAAVVVHAVLFTLWTLGDLLANACWGSAEPGASVGGCGRASAFLFAAALDYLRILGTFILAPYLLAIAPVAAWLTARHFRKSGVTPT